MVCRHRAAADTLAAPVRLARGRRSHRKDLALLALRVGTGGVLAAHGAQKLLGWFGGGGLKGTAQAMHHMGFRPGPLSALASGLGEAGGGAALALGLATPAAGAAAAGTMAGAAAVHAPAGFFAQEGGYEYPAFLGFSAAALGLAGPGRWSVDHVTKHRWDKAWMVPVAFGAAALGTAYVVKKRAAVLRATEAEEAQDADREAAQAHS